MVRINLCPIKTWGTFVKWFMSYERTYKQTNCDYYDYCDIWAWWLNSSVFFIFAVGGAWTVNSWISNQWFYINLQVNFLFKRFLHFPFPLKYFAVLSWIRKRIYIFSNVYGGPSQDFRNKCFWVLASNSNLLIPISFQPDTVIKII